MFYNLLNRFFETTKSIYLELLNIDLEIALIGIIYIKVKGADVKTDLLYIINSLYKGRAILSFFILKFPERVVKTKIFKIFIKSSNYLFDVFKSNSGFQYLLYIFENYRNILNKDKNQRNRRVICTIRKIKLFDNF